VPQELDLKKVLDDAGGYRIEAYRFIRDGLAHTVRMTHGVSENELADSDESRHVNGQQLCMGLRDFALKQYGLMARPVLDRWGIRETADFGRIVFAMVDAGLMRKTDEDSLADFQDIFDFEEEFRTPEETLVSAGEPC